MSNIYNNNNATAQAAIGVITGEKETLLFMYSFVAISPYS